MRRHWLLIWLILLLMPLYCLSQSTQFDMTTQLRQWSSTTPAHDGVVPIWNATTSTYVPGDPLVSPNIPAVVQKASNTSTGNVASLNKAYTSNVTKLNTLIVLCGIGNGTAPTITDTLSNTWKTAAQVANSTTFNVGIFYAVENGTSGADTVTCTNNGTTASVALEIYEVSGLVQPSATYTTSLLDATSTNTSGSAATSPTVTLQPDVSNELAFVAFGLGTAAQTITVTSPYVNDSGQLNPTTPSGLFSFVASSNLLTGLDASLPSASATSEPWAVAAATFRPAIFPIEGTTKPCIARSDYAGGIPKQAAATTIPDCGTDGLLHVASLPSIRPASYSTSKKFAASSTTDNAVISGNATTDVLLTYIKVSCTETTAGVVNLEVIKRSAADTGGTSASFTVVPDNSSYAAASTAALSYTGTGPSVGSAVGDIDNYQLGCLAAATAGANDIYILNRRQKPIVLHGTAEQVALNFGGAITGGNITVTFEWIEITKGSF